MQNLQFKSYLSQHVLAWASHWLIQGSEQSVKRDLNSNPSPTPNRWGILRSRAPVLLEVCESMCVCGPQTVFETAAPVRSLYPTENMNKPNGQFKSSNPLTDSPF